MTLHAGYAASRISSNLKGSTKQFGWLQAAATKVSSVSITSASPATIRIVIFIAAKDIESSSPTPSSMPVRWQIISGLLARSQSQEANHPRSAPDPCNQKHQDVFHSVAHVVAEDRSQQTAGLFAPIGIEDAESKSINLLA